MDSKKMREYKYIRNTLPISNRAMTLDFSSTFNIDDNEYTFILGMTWEDWVNSAFNKDGYEINNGSVMYGDLTVTDNNWNPVQVTAIIIENYNYKTT